MKTERTWQEEGRRIRVPLSAQLYWEHGKENRSLEKSAEKTGESLEGASHSGYTNATTNSDLHMSVLIKTARGL